MTFGAETRCSPRQDQLPFPFSSIGLKKTNASLEVGMGRRESAPPGRRAGQARIWVAPALVRCPAWAGRAPGRGPRGLMVMSHLLCLLCFAPKGKHISSYHPHQPQASCSKLEATSAGIFGIYFCVILDSSVIFQKYITGPAACLLCKYFCPIIIIIMILNRVLNTSCIPGAAARERGAVTTLIFQTNTQKVR